MNYVFVRFTARHAKSYPLQNANEFRGFAKSYPIQNANELGGSAKS